VKNLPRNNKTILAILAILCVAIPFAAATLLVKTTPSDTTLYVDPSSIEDPTILPGDHIIIHIVIDSVSNMKTCEFNLTFSPTILSVWRITKLAVQGQYPDSKVNFDSDAGYIWVSLTYKSAVTIASNTAILEIEFVVKDYGFTSLHFQSSELLDNAGQPITHETQDGSVKIIIRNIITKQISLLTHETYVGRVIPINVTVLNDGNVPENFTVSLFYDSTLVEAKNVTNLPPKENITLTFNWDTGAVSPSITPYTVKAEASTVPYEVNVTDNALVDGTIKLKIVGDVNGDGIVNINDLIAWDNAYGSHAGDGNWNEQADVNNDGIVDKADATLILGHYKETL
jgi:hypothetical protein